MARERSADHQDDDEAPGPLQKIRASICEIAELFAQKYLSDFPQLGSFVDGIWNMLTTVGPGTREDVVSFSLSDRRV
jgi:exportin-2 (importin alpha re-exporter)